MKNENVLLEKSYSFSIRIIKLERVLNNKSEYHISRQLLRSGTSIGANAEEANGCFTKKDFLSKMSISYKEARETRYWLRLLKETDLLPKDQVNSVLNDCEELLRILGSIIKTIKSKPLK